MPRVLIVDDEPNIRLTMTEFLSRAGYEAAAAADFDGAVALLDGKEFDAAVIDVILPRRSGIELLREIRGRSAYIPAILMTANPNLSDVPDMIREGAYDFMLKPVMKVSLLNAVSRAVETKRLTEDKRRLEADLLRHSQQLELEVAARTRELAEQHGFLRAVLDSSTGYAIVAIDPESRIILFNPGAEAMFRCRAAERIGGLETTLIGDERYGPADRPLLNWAQNAESGEPQELELKLLRAGGETFVGSITMTPIKKPDGLLIGYLGIIKDLTLERQNAETLRRMQARLAHNEKIAALGQMAAHVAHEVKNPLSGLRLYCSHLKNKVAGRLDPAELRIIDKISEAIDHLGDTVERVLDFVRPAQLPCSVVDLNQITLQALRLTENQLVEKNIEKSVDLAPVPLPGLINEAAVRSVIINIVLNAVQAMPDGGSIHIATAAGDGRLKLTIADTGSGMTQEQLANVFEPFYTTKGQGLGLGLPYAKKMIEEHRGTIEVSSTAGKGTEVEISFPAEV